MKKHKVETGDGYLPLQGNIWSNIGYGKVEKVVPM